MTGARDLKELTTDFNTNVEYLKESLGVKKSFDVIHRELEFAGVRMGLFFVDGFVKDDVLNVIFIHLAKLEFKDLNPSAVSKLLHTHIAYVETETVKDTEKIIAAVLAGPPVLLIEGSDTAIMIDARTYPARNPDEPDIERVVRGSRDGFTETLIFNTALTRRRLRDRSLRMEYLQIGRRSKTDIALAYLEDVADEQLVDTIRSKLQAVEVEGLAMADKTIEEFLFKRHWNPFPMVRYTERPDVAAIHLMEGHVLIYTDTSPSVMITPTTLFHHVQHAEEYRQKPIVGAYLRWVRFAAMLASVFVLPLWLLIAVNPANVPDDLRFLLPKGEHEVPFLLQALLTEIGIDALRMAAIHTPNALATALGLIAALMIGEIAVDVGLLTKNIILFLSISALGTFATPSYEFGMATRIVRLSLLVLTGFFHGIGLIAGTLFWFLLLAFTKSLNTPYLWPLLPFNGKALLDIIVRSPVPAKHKRPSVLQPKDGSRT
ncbi:spore gernimation protein GerA [Paenibacillus swuensis]|uniref:Spore gernimation protein GerA n=1 Tax=Paenibacillus swuensis TaxID=1178515 RepID=A0A172TPR9_9BACL|nr:spore gernimation protein GerA [Paenibacillus swuensis]